MWKEERRCNEDGKKSDDESRHDQNQTSLVPVPLETSQPSNQSVRFLQWLLSRPPVQEVQVQETMLRAWRHFDTFKSSASLRTWLYTIATNICLDVLKKRSPRILPTAVYPAADPSHPIASPIAEAIWLEPFPDT